MDLEFEIELKLPRLDKIEPLEIDRLLASISAP